MKTFFANNWRPSSGFLGQPAAAPGSAPGGAGAAAPAAAAPITVQFSPPTSFVYPPFGYVYPDGFPQVYQVSTPTPEPPSNALSYVIGGAAVLGVAALIALAARGR
jgi:hypothetical protein